MQRTWLSELSFWLHVPILMFWVGAFFIPQSVWPEVVVFHFWFLVAMYALGYIVGYLYLPYTKNLLLICVLTLFTQRLRGHSWTAPETWGHSFIGEVFKRIGIPNNKTKLNRSSFDTGSLITHSTLVLVTVQYFFGVLIL